MKKMINALKERFNKFMEAIDEETKDELSCTCRNYWCDYDPWLIEYPNPLTELYMINGSLQ